MTEPNTAWHVRTFQRDGYLKRTAMFTREEVMRLRSQLHRHHGESMVITELPEGMPVMLLEAWARTLLGSLVSLSGINYFDKPPDRNRATPPHQDAYYERIQPCEAVMLWVALDDADEANGCLRYVPGSHKLGLRHHRITEVHGFSLGIWDYPCEHDRHHELAVPVKAGDVLAHHCLTIHRADANESPRSRVALGLVYYRADVVEDTAGIEAHARQLALERALVRKT